MLTNAGHDETLGFEMWEDYSKDIVGIPAGTLKAWLRWNGQKFDAYLQAKQDVDDVSGFASHDTPYVDYS